MDAWIETRALVPHSLLSDVASLVDAWIETHLHPMQSLPKSESHPSWMRGLKQYVAVIYGSTLPSHPSWMRGLKPYRLMKTEPYKQVASLVDAWIETLRLLIISIALAGRIPRGCVD